MALEPDERRQWAAADASAVCKEAMKQRKKYDQITLVGKSIGTSAMGYLITTIPALPELQCLWLTPLLKNEHLRAQIKQIKHKALFVAGTSDPYYDEANLEDLLKTTGGESVIIEGADHSLEIDSDAMKSIEALERVMKGILKFLG